MKSMQSMGFYDWRDGTPAKPGFLLAKNAPKCLMSLIMWWCGLLPDFYNA
jgi:hypothetical protein